MLTDKLLDMRIEELVIHHTVMQYGVYRRMSAQTLVLLITQLPQNTGMSITNAIELITQHEVLLYLEAWYPKILHYPDIDLQVFEHYPAAHFDPEHFDEVTMSFEHQASAFGLKNHNVVFRNPQWHHVSKVFVMTCMGWL